MQKTLNPIFDECFEFSVTLEQCLVDGAMIAFTVMDHDVLTANDFAGEAFLALGNIPGVADYSTSIENFHGLKQVDLPLMQQNDKSMCCWILFCLPSFSPALSPSHSVCVFLIPWSVSSFGDDQAIYYVFSYVKFCLLLLSISFICRSSNFTNFGISYYR